jgi:Caspase domain
MAGYAVFIGVTKYDHDSFDSHETIGRSAKRLKELFEKSRLWDECLSLDPATPTELIDGIRPLGRACKREDMLLVYFCGHGEFIKRSDQHRELHLATRKSESKNYVTQLPIHLVYDELRQAKAKAKVLVLDCCDSGEVPVLGPRDREPADIIPDDQATSVLTALRRGMSKADAGREAGDYTAFSGALIDILSEGLGGAGDPLTVSDVFQEMVQRLGQARHPKPDVISRGMAAGLPLLENVGMQSRARELLDKCELPELARMWAGKQAGENVPINVVRQYVRGRLRDGRAVVELAHQLHRQSEESEELLLDLAEMVLSGPDDLAASTIRSFARSECTDCQELYGELLRRAATVLTPEPLIGILLDQKARQRAEVEIAAAAQADQLAGILDGLRLRADRRSSAVADRLIDLFATQRKHVEVRELLTKLRSDGKNFDAGTVLIDVALGRPPADAAAFVQLVRDAAEPDGSDVSRLVVEHRRPR